MRFADRYIRFFPKSVTHVPNEVQVVKVQLIKSNELALGEYRPYFYFKSVLKIKPFGEEEAVKDTIAISVRLTLVFVITIPVIIRVGESTAKVSLPVLELDIVNDTVPRLKLVFKRIGNMSFYGDLVVDYISTQSKITRVGSANGIAVYTLDTIRRFQFNLSKVPGVDFRAGTLRVIYSAPSDFKPVRVSEAEFQLH